MTHRPSPPNEKEKPCLLTLAFALHEYQDASLTLALSHRLGLSIEIELAADNNTQRDRLLIALGFFDKANILIS
jgi:hypothetical protein